VVERLREVLPNEIGELRALDEQALRRFLLGLLANLKSQGGIFHPALKEYVESWGNTWFINRKIVWMQKFGWGARSPAFLTTKKVYRFQQVISSTQNRFTWCQVWAEKCLGLVNPLIRGATEQLYEWVLKVLVEEAILEERQHQNHRVWGLLPASLRVDLDVVQFQCRRCSHNVSVSGIEKQDWQQAPCLRFQCSGLYSEVENYPDYYRKLYATSDVERIFAEEHTGLLQREDREELEWQFKAGTQERKPWFPNLLSCTPTLEMGIDIGDLSSVVLCSVPPAQSNYVQRIGRAGRRDGNALNLTVANARPHDLFFFSEPEEMIVGKIAPPGVFLKASAVLERQFTAFCFDRWVETGVSVGAIPFRLGQVLSNLDPVDVLKFPHNLLLYIETRQTELLERFLTLFQETMPKELRDHLRGFVGGDQKREGSLRYRIMEGLHGLAKDRESLRRKVRLLRERIRKKEQDPVRDQNYEEELSELKREKYALQSLAENINDRDTFNFFTDEGLLPNYAFPEGQE
jgi:DEAD/DEAH box helicase domain-containing protein